MSQTASFRTAIGAIGNNAGIVVPPEVLAELSAGQRPSFDPLANSLQRMHAGLVADAKTPETRERRILKAVALFKDGKKR